jgi:hypothetical protein
MQELKNLEIEPNLLERAVIEWEVTSLKKYLIDQNLLLRLGYSEKEIKHMQRIFFGIIIANPSQMTYFEKAVYYNDRRTIENYYYYMKKNKSAMESYGYTVEDLKNIHYVHFQGNERLLTSRTDYYEIYKRLDVLQKNKNKVTEMYILKYLKEAEAELLHKKEALDKLIMIYREEEYIPERKEDIKKLILLYPEVLKYSQLARSLEIELLYRDKSNEERYKKICERVRYYEKAAKEDAQKEDTSKQSEEDDGTPYSLEVKAKYLYAIALEKCGEDGWSYFIEEELEKQTNVSYMRDFLEVSKTLIKKCLKNSDKMTYSKILNTMAEKAEGLKAGADYSFLLYLNREFGDEFGISRAKLEELYKNADRNIEPFKCNGYGAYLYALAQDYIRENNTLDGFAYRDEFLCLKRDFYSYFSKKMEEKILEGPADCEAIQTKIGFINTCILTGERKFFKKEGYGRVKSMPRFLCFFPEQDSELNNKYDEVFARDLELSRQSNSNRDLLYNLKLSMLPSSTDQLDCEAVELLNELSYYAWKKLQYNFEQSKDQWLILAKIYEYYMNFYKQQAEREREVELRNAYIEVQQQWAAKVAKALRIRAELGFVYADWYDLYQFYLKQVDAADKEDKLDWIKAAYELYLEIAYKVRNDSDQVGKHFVGLSTHLKINNYFRICISQEKRIANQYVEELATLYYQYRQYRYLKLAFEITKESGEYEHYLRKFIRALVQWEIIQLVNNILYLLQEGEYTIAQLFYRYSEEHINHTPGILGLTYEIMEGLAAESSSVYKRILSLLTAYPNVQKVYYIERGTDNAMTEHITALEFIQRYYTATVELTGELDCSSIQYALYLQYQQLYSRSRRDEHLEKMFKALELTTRDEDKLPNKYKLITLCYRFSSLKQDAKSVIERLNLSQELTDKLRDYQQRLEKLKSVYSNKNNEAFLELCDLTLHYSYKNIDKTIEMVKSFIKKHILSNELDMTVELRDYLMSIEMIEKVWLQLYFEEDEEIVKGRSLADYTIAFQTVYQVIQALEDSKKTNKSLLNIEIIRNCVTQSMDMDSAIALVQEGLVDDDTYRYERLELIHHFFEIMSKDEGISLYTVIDTINKKSGYQNSHCTDLLYQLYSITDNLTYLTSLARQHAKAGNYSAAKESYDKVLDKVKNNRELERRYAYIRIHKAAMSLLDLAKNNKPIKLAEMEEIKANQVYEVLAYLSSKYSETCTTVMELMEEEERNLFHYIDQLISFERYKYERTKRNNKNKKNSITETSSDADDEMWEKKLFDTLLLLKDTRYFSYLLPNLYQVSDNPEFKYSIASYKDKRIQAVLRENKNKPVLVLNEQKLKQGQRLILMDYGSQTLNAYLNLSEENQDIPRLQEIINNYSSDEPGKPISDLLHELERETRNKKRKDLLLRILADQSYQPDDMEKDTRLQRSLQLLKAELGYLLHLEAFEGKDYETSVLLLQEGVICLGSNKSDCLVVLEKIREQYCKVLEQLPERSFQRMTKLFPNIAYGIHRIVKLYNNKNNPKNILLDDMLVIIGLLHAFATSIHPTNDIELLETAIERLATFAKNLNGQELKLIKSISKKWKDWINTELLQIVSKEIIKDNKYFINRKDNKALEIIYQEIVQGSKHINLYGPKGIGVSSLIRQCCQGCYEKALEGGKLFLSLDFKETSNDNIIEDFSKELYQQIHQNIKKIIDLGYLWGEELLDNMKRSDGTLNYLDGLRRQEEIHKVYLFLDHYDEMSERAKVNMDKLFLQLQNKGIQLVIGSEAKIKESFIPFLVIELTAFTFDEARAYLRSRLKYKKDKLHAISEEEVYRLTNGIPALLSYMVEYILKSDSFSYSDGKIYLMSEAKAYLESWEPEQDSVLVDAKIEAAKAKMKAEVKAEMAAELEGKIEAAKVEINAGVGAMVEAKYQEILSQFGKEAYVREHNLENKKEINLKKYHQSIPWNEEAEVNIEEFGMSEEMWEVIKREEDVYQYIKYGEALRRFTRNIQQPQYDYSVFALNYCLAFELLSNKMMKSFFIEKIPEHDVSSISECRYAGITKLKESLDTTTYTVGSYKNFLYAYQSEYKAEVKKLDFDFYNYYCAYKEAKNIRNDVAHVGNKVYVDKFTRFLDLLFGDSKKPVGQVPVFEGICRLVSH